MKNFDTEITKILEPHEDFTKMVERLEGSVPCPFCQGMSVDEEYPCIMCKGTNNAGVYELISEALYSSMSLPITDLQTKEFGAVVQFIPGQLMDLRTYAPGPMQCEVMVIGRSIEAEEEKEGRSFCTPSCTDFIGVGNILPEVLSSAGIPMSRWQRWYYTNMVKFRPPDVGASTIKAGYYKLCRYLLLQEIKLVNPRAIILLGADPVKNFFNRKTRLTDVRGTFLEYQGLATLGQPPVKAIADADKFVYATLSPRQLISEPSHKQSVINDFKRIGEKLKGNLITTNPLKNENYLYIDNIEVLEETVNWLVSKGKDLFAVDCEWGGDHYRTGWLRSIQFSWAPGTAAVLIMERVDRTQPFADTMDRVVAALSKLLCRRGVGLIGHNLRADLAWLVDMGVDCVDNVHFDTMLASHALNEAAQHGLEVCALQYTNMGKYDFELTQWIEQNPIPKGRGYADVPDDILYPYSACDADATFQIYLRLRVDLAKHPPLERCFFQTTMKATKAIFKMETTGVLVDRERLESLVDVYSQAKDIALAKLRELVGKSDFNPRSVNQVRDLLFRPPPEGLGFEPYKTTGKPASMWSEIRNDPKYEQDRLPADQRRFKASTDNESLNLLSGVTPEVHQRNVRRVYKVPMELEDAARAIEVAELLNNFKMVDQVTKNFVADGDDDEEGDKVYEKGLMSVIDPRDGAIRTTISQMTNTGRYRSYKPNLQNLPKNREKTLNKVMTGLVGYQPESIRSCFIARPGYVLVEADYRTAEVFTLAYLSGDEILEADAAADIHSLNAVELLGAPEYPGYRNREPPPEAWKDEYGAIRGASKTITFGIPLTFLAELKPFELLEHLRDQAISSQSQETGPVQRLAERRRVSGLRHSKRRAFDINSTSRIIAA